MANTKVILKGSYGEGNFGDDALMYACVQTLKKNYDNSEIAIISKNKVGVNAILPSITVIRNQQLGIRKYDLLVYGGGTQFFSFPLTREIIIKKSIVVKLFHALVSPRIFVRYFMNKFFPFEGRFKKRAALSVGLGPFVDKSQEETRARKVFEGLDFVAVRDAASMKSCREWGVVASFRSDICFASDLWNYGSVELGGKNEKNIAVIVRDWPHSKEGEIYICSLIKAVQQLRVIGFNIDYISFCEKADSKWINILSNSNEKYITWNPMEDKLDEFLRMLSGYSCIVTARYHGAVFGVMLGVPVICVDVEQKLEQFSNMLPGYSSLWKQPFDVKELVQALLYVDNNYDEISRIIDEVKKKQEKLAMLMVEEFNKFVKISMEI